MIGKTYPGGLKRYIRNYMQLIFGRGVEVRSNRCECHEFITVAGLDALEKVFAQLYSSDLRGHE